jgi:hypothetical protein
VVLNSGAGAMSALGCGSAAGLAALEEVRELCATIEADGGGVVGSGVLASLGQAVQRVSNLMLVNGIVTPENAGEMMTTLSTALSLMGENEGTSGEALAAGVSAIGRLAAMDVVEMPVDDAVEMVMDIMQLNAGSALVRESAVHCMGNFATSARAVKAMASQGCMEVMTATLKSHPGDAHLMEVVQDALRKVTVATRESVAEMVGTTAGADALAGVLEANAVDEQMLVDCVASIAEVEGGENALWEVLASDKGGSSEVTTEALRVLTVKQEIASSGSAVTRAPPNAAKAKGLVKSMATAMLSATKTKDAVTADARGKAQAAKIASSTLSMLDGMDLDAECAEVRRRRLRRARAGTWAGGPLRAQRCTHTHARTPTHSLTHALTHSRAHTHTRTLIAHSDCCMTVCYRRRWWRRAASSPLCPCSRTT